MAFVARRSRPHLFDSISRPITLNQTLAYPVRQGSRMWMETGVVIGVNMDTEGLYARLQKPNGRVVKFRNFQRSVIV